MTQKETTTMTRDEAADLLDEIRHDLLTLLDEADRALETVDPGAHERAQVYWLAHVLTALKNDHGFLGGSMVTFEDTINEVRGNDDEDDGESASNADEVPEATREWHLVEATNDE